PVSDPFFFQHAPPPSSLYTLSLHDALPILSVPAYTLYPLPDHLDFELGALVEPMAVAVHGIHLVNVAFGERVLVLGSGTIGLYSDRKSTRLNSSHQIISYAVFCLKKKIIQQ